jgi:hypothetical protein
MLEDMEGDAFAASVTHFKKVELVLGAHYRCFNLSGQDEKKHKLKVGSRRRC